MLHITPASFLAEIRTLKSLLLSFRTLPCCRTAGPNRWIQCPKSYAHPVESSFLGRRDCLSRLQRCRPGSGTCGWCYHSHCATAIHGMNLSVRFVESTWSQRVQGVFGMTDTSGEACGVPCACQSLLLCPIPHSQFSMADLSPVCTSTATTIVSQSIPALFPFHYWLRRCCLQGGEDHVAAFSKKKSGALLSAEGYSDLPAGKQQIFKALAGAAGLGPMSAKAITCQYDSVGAIMQNLRGPWGKIFCDEAANLSAGGRRVGPAAVKRLKWLLTSEDPDGKAI